MIRMRKGSLTVSMTYKNTLIVINSERLIPMYLLLTLLRIYYLLA